MLSYIQISFEYNQYYKMQKKITFKGLIEKNFPN